MPALIFGLATGQDTAALLARPTFWISVVCMALFAGLRAQDAFESNTTVGASGAPTRDAPVIGDLAGDRRRSLAAYAAQVTLIATFALLCYALSVFGRSGFSALPIVFAVLLVFYDARPDVGRRIFPQLWTRS